MNAQVRTLGLLEASLEAGVIDLTQVDQFRQAIETERATLLQAENGLLNSLESYLRDPLGLPPDIPVTLDDALIEPFQLIDAAGCRGLRIGGAMVSEKHCNFLINADEASAEDIERLGETVRARVKATSGIDLNWEIIRLGEPLADRPVGEALAAL